MWFIFPSVFVEWGVNVIINEVYSRVGYFCNARVATLATLGLEESTSFYIKTQKRKKEQRC